jgi:predicted RNA-binding protein with RPS1 domain
MKVGDIVQGEITAIKPYGAFVKIDDNTSGLIHISQISDHFVRDIEDYVSLGDVFKLEIIDIAEDGKVSLNFKKFNHRKKRYPIRLTSGFAPLKEKLPWWVAQYYAKDSEE